MSLPTTEPRYRIIDFARLQPVACPCGTARRALADVPELPFTLHQTEISLDARAHYHKRLTEVYYIVECASDARMELDGVRVRIAAGQAIVIPPLVRHVAIGRMKVIVIAYPKFDPTDEWFDE
jgi:mannose-6-phosphate isomerase-like protein (cupin superfamily)